MEGDSVTLSFSLDEAQIKEGIAWKFGHQEMTVPETTIAELEDKGDKVRFYKDRAEGRFRDRLELNKQTGSLTITNTNITHTGLYKVINTKTKDQLKTFNLTVYGVFGSESVLVMEGDSVTLSVNLTETQRKEGITWKFGAEITIAEIEVGGKYINLYEERADGRFRGRLKLDHSGSLTITNTRTTDSRLYQLINTNTKNQLNIFNLTVYARLPVPVISRVSSPLSSSSICSLLCSVINVRDVSLSWYKGNSLLSSISVSDHSSISLHLKCLDDSYSCVMNNTIRNQTHHLNTDLCHTCSGTTDVKETCSWCGFTEVVIRLVVSVLVGVAAVGFVVYDIRSRRDEEKRMRSDKLH
ncbi:uncharacterized protein [Misgurnus anguillicaudatus]|uniref:uncharacterized protein n=1 Tax=Misgurnus anguillicaudatus TaxID=75329 RepID=UPI003CCF9440